MPILRRTKLAWSAFNLLERGAVMQLPADKVRKASNRRNRLARLPGVQLLTGIPDRSVTTEDTSFRTPDGTSLRLRVYRPRDAGPSAPVVMNFHGGGFVSGNPEQSEWWCAGIAAGSGAVVVSVDYRLAPEHPFPVPVEDCYAATEWVAAHGPELGVDPSRMAVMGDSAGGTLAAVISILSRDRGGPPIALQILMYPGVRFDDDYPSRTENAKGPVLTAKDIDNVPRLYLGRNERKDPLAAPLFAAHHDLAPALIQTAEHDPLRDHGPAYADALRAAGVPVRLTNYVNAVHGYISLPNIVPGSRQAMSEAVAELRASLGVR